MFFSYTVIYFITSFISKILIIAFNFFKKYFNTPKMKTEVVFNVPNTIGFIRILLLAVAIFTKDALMIVSYCISALLDFFDGYTARKFNQSTMLGSILDMITDRISTVIISFKIIEKKPEITKFLAFYVFVDLLSHFIYFHVNGILGVHHKSQEGKNVILKIYYNKQVLGPICLLSELFFVDQYMFPKGHGLSKVLTGAVVAKCFFHIAQLYSAIDKGSYIEDKKNY